MFYLSDRFPYNRSDRGVVLSYRSDPSDYMDTRLTMAQRSHRLTISACFHLIATIAEIERFLFEAWCPYNRYDRSKRTQRWNRALRDRWDRKCSIAAIVAWIIVTAAIVAIQYGHQALAITAIIWTPGFRLMPHFQLHTDKNTYRENICTNTRKNTPGFGKV